MKKHLIYLFIIISFIYITVQNYNFVETLKLKTFDVFVEKKEPSGNFVILDITDQDVRDRGGYPFPRKDLAQIQVDLINKGALGVGWVISFVDADRFGGDQIFADYLNYIPTVVATFETDNNLKPPTTGTVILGQDVYGIEARGYIPNIELIKKNVQEGLVSAPVDIDNLVRKIPLLYKSNDGWTPSFGTQVLKVLAGADTYIIKTSEAGIEEIRVPGIPPTPLDNLGRKWISWVNTPKTTLKEMDVEGKFVFIGVTAKGVMPQVAVPTGLVYPHHVQAALAESILIEDSPYIPNYALLLEITILIVSTLFVWLILNTLNLSYGLLGFGLVLFGTSYYGIHLIRSGLLVDVTWSLVASFFTGATAFYLNYSEQYKLRQQIKKQFEHYLDPRQVKKLQDNPELLKLGGEKRYCTYLFTDVRGFTNLSEQLEPEEVTELMNKALTIQAKVVQDNGGMVDKYIGDAMMAIFNAPIELDNHEDAAIKTAIQIRHEIKAAQLGIEIGIGLSSGEAVIGNMGSKTRFDYTAIGDAVNLGARMESSCKELKTDLVIAEHTMKASSYKLKSLGQIKVKGKNKPIKVYTER